MCLYGVFDVDPMIIVICANDLMMCKDIPWGVFMCFSFEVLKKMIFFGN